MLTAEKFIRSSNATVPFISTKNYIYGYKTDTKHCYTTAAVQYIKLPENLEAKNLLHCPERIAEFFHAIYRNNFSAVNIF